VIFALQKNTNEYWRIFRGWGYGTIFEQRLWKFSYKKTGHYWSVPVCPVRLWVNFYIIKGIIYGAGSMKYNLLRFRI